MSKKLKIPSQWIQFGCLNQVSHLPPSVFSYLPPVCLCLHISVCLFLTPCALTPFSNSLCSRCSCSLAFFLSLCSYHWIQFGCLNQFARVMKLGWRFIKQLIKRNPLSAIDVARYTSFMATQLGYGFAVVDTYRELFRDNLQLLREVNERDLLTLIDILETRHADEQGSVTLSLFDSLSLTSRAVLGSLHTHSHCSSFCSACVMELGSAYIPSSA